MPPESAARAHRKPWLPVLLTLLAWIPAAGAQETSPIERIDLDRVTGAEACGECHVSAYEVWKGTTHATGFKSLHRTGSAESIAERMGFKLIKRNSMCLDCHYTPTQRDDDVRALSGVSCESCHGAGRDWIEVHNDYGGKGIDHTTETPEHREQRLAASREAGMRSASDLYAVASACYGCHTVPEERLVNVGKHSLGSPEFELAAWNRGEIRHNFLDSFLDGDGTDNAERPPPHQRRTYVLGRALALEHALRGVAAATENGVYLKAMQGRLRDALSELRLLSRVGELPEVDEMLAAARAAKARLGHRDDLLAAADRVGDAARRFLHARDGTRLAAIDPLVEGRYEDLDLDEPELADDELDDPFDEGPETGEPLAGETQIAAVGTDPSTPGAVPESAAGGNPQPRGIPAEGERRTHLRPRSAHDTLSATACSKCHGDQHAWWYDDRHNTSIDPFLDRDPAVIKIARLYGLSTSKINRADSLCMDCHGTATSNRRGREVQDGVSCQSCHGPAADFLEPHQEGEKSLGRQRPGFRKALQLGMADLRDLETRIANCASCHYVTDPRLISSGHPTGADFDPVEGMASVRHWEEPLEGRSALQTTWQAQLAKRGPVPKVRRARLAPRPTRSGAAGAGGVADADASVDIAAAPGPRRPRVLTPRPARGASTAGGSRVGSSSDAGSDLEFDLPAFPEFDAETSIEDLLSFLKQRLEALYRTVGPRRAPRSPENPGQDP